MLEAHLIAWYYHWDAFSIKKLSTRERKEWCNLIRAQVDAQNKANQGK